MTYLIWGSPLLVVILTLATRRASALLAGLVGAALAILIAATMAPSNLAAADLIEAVAEGLWLAWLVGAVILSGLFFRSAAAQSVNVAGAIGSLPGYDSSRRRQAFAACFLIGPFAEAATGFGVGQVTTIAILLTLSLGPLQVAVLGLFSQILVPWGAMANGTMVGAAFSGLQPWDLGFHSALVNAPLVLGWLALFWRIAAWAGLAASGRRYFAELGWVVLMLAGLPLANLRMGPEIAALMMLGPLIVLQVVTEERPDRSRATALLRMAMPYAILIAVLATTRAVPAVNTALREAALVQPFAGSLTWFPLLHPSTWLALLAILAAVFSGRAAELPRIAADTWRQGWKAVATIGAFLVLAQIMAASGSATALSEGLAIALGTGAIVASPVLAGLFGFVTGSGNATNALLMTAQVRLAADYGLPLIWIASVQNVAAAALTMLSPARVAMACALVGRKGLEGEVYARAWHLGALPIALLVLLCLLVWTTST